MKKITYILLWSFLFKMNHVFSQFAVYTAPTTFNISDIDYSSTLSKVIIATDSGVYFFDGNNWSQTTTANGLPANDVKCLAVAPSGDILTGTASGLAKWNGIYWEPYTLNTSQSFSFVSAIYINPGTDTLYGTDNGKLLKKGTSTVATNIVFNPAVGMFTDIGHMNPPGSYDFIIATSMNGAVIYDLPTTQTFVVNTSSTPIPSNNILSHAIEGNKTYDGTDQGVYIPDFTNFPSTPFVIYNTSNSQLPSNIVQAVAVRNGVQYYGTPSGLAKHQGSTWTIYNTANSNLPNNNIVELAYDTVGNILWIGTGDGKLSKLDLSLLVNEKSGLDDYINVFPNPSSGTITVSLSDILDLSGIHLTIINSIGEIVSNRIIDSFIFDIKISNPGIYMLQLFDNNRNIISPMKLVII
jgi:ligand-binding sensor domain-containing protein